MFSWLKNASFWIGSLIAFSSKKLSDLLEFQKKGLLHQGVLAKSGEKTARRRPSQRSALAAENVVRELAGDLESLENEVDQPGSKPGSKQLLAKTVHILAPNRAVADQGEVVVRSLGGAIGRREQLLLFATIEDVCKAYR